MKRARSFISLRTSSWLSGRILTVVIWVTTLEFSRISGIAAPPVVRDNAGTTTPVSERSAVDRRNRLGDRDRAPRHVGMHALDHAAIDLHHTLVLVVGLLERRDDLSRLGDLVVARREHGVARR